MVLDYGVSPDGVGRQLSIIAEIGCDPFNCFRESFGIFVGKQKRLSAEVDVHLRTFAAVTRRSQFNVDFGLLLHKVGYRFFEISSRSHLKPLLLI